MFIDRLRTEISTAVNDRLLGALMFIDLDNFKVLNDSYGHTVGDQLLRQIAQRLAVLTGTHALAARLGGDEFVVMWPGLSPVESLARDKASAFAWQIRRAILDPYELSTLVLDASPAQGAQVEQFLHYHISGSIGVTLFGADEEPVAEVLKRADVAMYQSKQGGKDTIRIFDPKVQSALSERVALSTELNAALAKDQLLLHYQLQTTASGQAVGAECLLRWQHPVRGMVSPVEFIALAEDSGAIIGMGDWVLHQACQTLAQWSGVAHLQHLTLSVNVSPRQFIDADFVLRVEKSLADSGANPRLLCLEITEGIVLQDADQVIEKMHRLCAIGLSFSIDDFGTGYSSLSYLQRLPLRELKIDKTFVNDLASNTTSEAIVRAIVALGQSMQIDVLAEGVETDAQKGRLTALGCERMQGYLFARPMALAAMEHKLLPPAP
jgi:diguanylate cyclase (GGDEF)-like protein